MPEILFVCTANQFRSVLAAAYFQRKLQENGAADDWKVSSAGTWAGGGFPAHPLAVVQALRCGLDLSRHRSREVSKPILDSADLIIVMEKNHRESIDYEFPSASRRISLLTELAGNVPVSIIDPVMTGEDPTEITDEIFHYIDAGYDEILSKAAANAAGRR